jgi:hypothetical protein
MSRLTRMIHSVCTLRDALGDHSLLPLQQPDFPVAVCWSAKSGCTTVLKWFLSHNQLLDQALAYSTWVHDYRQRTLFQAPGYRRQCERLFKKGSRNRFIVKVIRDPATRAVSSFLHFQRYGYDPQRFPDAAVVTQWKSAFGLERQSGLSFRQFLMFVMSQRLNGCRLNLHFRPQVDPQQDPCVDAYIRLEDLADGLRAVEDRVGLPHVDLRSLSKSAHHNPATTGHAWPTLAAAFPADQHALNELGTPPAQAFLDPETKMLIRTAYGSDYEAYGEYYDAAPAALLMSAASRDMSTMSFRRSRRQAA